MVRNEILMMWLIFYYRLTTVGDYDPLNALLFFRFFSLEVFLNAKCM
jgi:hypothetical protein